jgi:hypothetical protein
VRNVRYAAIAQDMLAMNNPETGREKWLTWNNIPRVHRILILNEAEATHDLNLVNLAMRIEVFFEFLFGD